MRGNNMCFSFGLEQIFDNAEFNISNNEKVGIVGVNGAGKTTLFKLLLGKLELDSGVIHIDRSNIGYLPQEIILEDKHKTVWDYMYEGRPIKKLESELEKTYIAINQTTGTEQQELLNKAGKIQESLEFYDLYKAEDILLDIVINMEIDFSLFDKAMEELSGGQKSKIAFAKLLFSKKDILFLDEPTNHLDATTKDFVVNYLKNYSGAILIISHDVRFLDEIINKVLYINKVTKKISMYKGNYTDYKKALTEEQRLRELLIVQQEREIKKLTEFVYKAKYANNGNRDMKKMGLEREAKLEKKKQNLLSRDKVYKQVNMSLNMKKGSSPASLYVEDLAFSYPDEKALFNNLTFSIRAGERLLISGENGVGKSTLLKLLTGILSPHHGSIKFDCKTNIAYYAQEFETLDLDKTVLENVDNNKYEDWKLRSILSNFLFYDVDVFKKVKVLSSGEKARLSLCKVFLENPGFLILDEPTNHLDPETQKVIGYNFKLFKGTIVLVSHDVIFTEQLSINRILKLPSGEMSQYAKVNNTNTLQRIH